MESVKEYNTQTHTIVRYCEERDYDIVGDQRHHYVSELASLEANVCIRIVLYLKWGGARPRLLGR